MKNNKGISISSLIITIIVIIILAGITVYYSYNKNLNKATFTKIYNEMQEVSNAVVQRSIEHKIDKELYKYAGKDLSVEPQEVAGVQYGEGYYLVKSSEIMGDLGVSNVNRDYIVNYDTGEIISVEAIYMGNVENHTIQDLIDSELDASVTVVNGEYDSEKGVNKPLVSKGMVPVKFQGSNWVVTTEDDPNWYDYSADSNKWANIMLVDELEVTGMTNDQVRASSIEEMANREVVKEGSAFVWIPRYTYKEADGSIVYSKLTTDYTADGYVKQPAFYFGEYDGATTSGTSSANTGYKSGGTELTGIWLSKYEAGYGN